MTKKYNGGLTPEQQAKKSVGTGKLAPRTRRERRAAVNKCNGWVHPKEGLLHGAARCPVHDVEAG